MNITDLREELHLQADELSADPSSISGGVASRIAATRRRRVAGTLVGVSAAVVVGGLLLTNQPGQPLTPAPAVSSPTVTTGADGMPSRFLPDQPGDVIKDGLRFRAKVAENTLAAGVISEPGARSTSATWTVTTQHVSYVAECWLLPGTEAQIIKDTMVRASISGTEGYVASSCQTLPSTGRDLPDGAVRPGEPGEGLPELELDTEATLTVQLVTRDGEPTAVPGAQLAAAVYALGPERTVTDKSGVVVAAVPEVLEHQGYPYRLRRLVDGPLGERQLPTAEAPASGPYLVTYGTVDTGDLGADLAYFRLAGLDHENSLIQEGGLTTAPVPTASGQALELELAEGTPPEQGTGIMAIYVPAD